MRYADLGSLPLMLLLAVCDSSTPPKHESTKPDEKAVPTPTEVVEPPPAGESPKPAEPEPEPEPTPTPSPAGDDLELAAPTAPLATLAAFAGPLRFDPVEAGDGRLPASNTALIDAGEGTMMDHPIEFGWAADSGSFGYCQPSGGADCTECGLVPVGTGAVETWTRGEDCNSDDTKKIAAEWKARKIGKQPIPKRWAFGRDLVIAWKMEPGVAAAADGKGRLSELHIGAKVGDEEPVFFVTMKEESFAEIWFEHDIYPELIIPSPDGQRLAIMSHSFAGEYSDTLGVQMEDAAEFAFSAYYRTALGLLASKPARAAELLAEAAKIKPGAFSKVVK